jgi:hypothetical protein
MAKPPTEFEIEVDGEPYLWWLQRRPQWSNKPEERRGMGIGVRHHEGKRQVVIEFPPASAAPRFGGAQLQPQQIPTALVKKAIASAVGAGWDPYSRGKPVTIAVDETGA